MTDFEPRHLLELSHGSLYLLVYGDGSTPILFALKMVAILAKACCKNSLHAHCVAFADLPIKVEVGREGYNRNKYS